jgi:hypothetical protein
VGLTRQQTLGKRLRDHLQNRHKGKWDRFSWFGFKQVLKRIDKDGLHLLRSTMPKSKAVDPHTTIKEMEALLIKSMALSNRSDSRFVIAKQWHQVRLIEVDALLAKLK